MERTTPRSRCRHSGALPWIAVGRDPRIQAADSVYHITTRGVRRAAIYEDGIDHRKFETLLERVVIKRGWELYAYCEMPNHNHLLLKTPEADISDGMCWLNGVYARWFNQRHGYSGHVFEARFYSEIVRSNLHLLNLACYIPLNPVRAGLCLRPGDWPWSSYRATVGPTHESWLETTWLLAQFGRDEATAVAEYERYVQGRMAA